METCSHHNDQKKMLDGFGNRVSLVEKDTHGNYVEIQNIKGSLERLEDNIWKAIDNLRMAHVEILKEMNQSITNVLVKISWIYGALFVGMAVFDKIKDTIK